MNDVEAARKVIDSIMTDKDIVTDMDWMKNAQAIRLIGDVLNHDLTRAERVAICRATCTLDVITVIFGDHRA